MVTGRRVCAQAAAQLTTGALPGALPRTSTNGAKNSRRRCISALVIMRSSMTTMLLTVSSRKLLSSTSRLMALPEEAAPMADTCDASTCGRPK